jgi:aspartyl-tRNA(Asn)/glutamyl-tRNA(Gln) amidotransferase subunit B
VQETRRWEDAKGSSFSMRSKEDAVDYRYFPEPDMPPLQLDEHQIAFPPAKGEGGEAGRGSVNTTSLFLPYTYIKTCKNDFGFNKEFINALLLDKTLFDFFFTQVEKGFEPKTIAKWIAGPVLKS